MLLFLLTNLLTAQDPQIVSGETHFCAGDNTQLTAWYDAATDGNLFNLTAPFATDECEGAVMATTSDTITYIIPGTYLHTWNYVDALGNTSSQDQTVIVNAPLPVELVDFTVHCDKSFVSIKWETATKTNSSHFNVQRSQDGVH